MGVEGAQGAGLGLHLVGRGVPAAVHRGQYVHGVVAGVQEDSAPQVRDLVRLSFRDADRAAAVAESLQFPLRDGVPDAAGQRGEHGEGEERLEGAGGRQRAVRVVRGEHIAGARVGHQPRQRRHVRDLGCPGPWPHLRAGPVQRRRLQRRGFWGSRVDAGAGDGRARHQSECADHAEGGAGANHAG
ncbi:hypothetical protein SAV14893_003980 [Streptomyces avermitilis]|uniref:Uncharacterized protein n=1 Tax=Streptomyces avermitilis TaxID=33903 RepID=A0A4D4LJ86_STRAX|nr:hypothetical protein SAVMC3_15890 [Streptomyces avermitilis]GDY61005.1 hypothetical protein SAV14893_003980 [Streptomyces avermitilis]GDY78918.1 hypothetical protein SAV31267_084030 [Streptomyces avermitilis]GDY87736.1 hypothetical protein SAVCW2_69350 [Streptomyces avermitilis]